jgi:hypothetical protein
MASQAGIKIFSICKSQGSSSIYIGSTESANQKVGTLVIGKNDLAIDKDGIVDLDIGRSFIV